MRATHHVKIWPSFFQRIANREKCFEVRVNDRDYQSGDVVALHAWDPLSGLYIGRGAQVTIRHLQQGTFGLPPNVCVFDWNPDTVIARLEAAGLFWERDNTRSGDGLAIAAGLGWF
jgi:hypothetical protein